MQDVRCPRVEPGDRLGAALVPRAQALDAHDAAWALGL
jgi:hypothetical protein